MKFIFATDFHLKDTNPVSRIDDYKESIFEKMYQVSNLANKLGAYTIIGGDVFTIKDSVRVSHGLARRVTAWMQEFNNPPYLLIGNHDINYDNLETVKHQPIGQVIQSGSVYWSGSVSLKGKAGLMSSPKEGFILDDGKIKVRLLLRDYQNPFKVSKDYFNIEESDCDYTIMATHFNFTVNSDYFYSEPAIPYSNFYDKKLDVLFNGHLHNMGSDSIFRRDNQYFLNPGALSRGSISEDDVSRNPAVSFVSIDSDGIDVKNVLLRAKPAEEVFCIEDRNKYEDNKIKISEFISSLAGLSNDGEDSFDDILGRMELKKDILDEVNSYLVKASE